MSSKYEDELGLIVMDNCKELGNKIDQNIMQRRSKKDSFIIPTNLVRFNNGEGKAVIEDSVRDKDLYIISDIGNHSMTYKMYGYLNHMGPDEHFMDIKRVISAVRGQADRVTVLLCHFYMNQGNIEEREENHLIVHLHFKNYKI